MAKFAKGMFTGAMVGAGAAMLLPLDRKGVRRFKRKVTKAAQTVCDSAGRLFRSR